MTKINKQDLSKIGTVSLVGILSLLLIIFWLKGHKIHNFNKFTFYFRSVNGLEEGNALRWNGLKIGVVESIKPVGHSFTRDPLPAKALIELGKRHINEAKGLLNSKRIEDLIIAQEEISKAELEISLGKASSLQNEIKEGDHVAVTVVVTTPDVPIGPLNQVTIVPSGVIGEQYVDISTIDIDVDFERQYDVTQPKFVVLEPVKLDTLIRLNTESAEAIKNLANRINALFSNQDAKNVKTFIEGVSRIVDDRELFHSIKQSSHNIELLTDDFSLWTFLGFSKNKKDKENYAIMN